MAGITQHDAIAEAMRRLGGFATLSQLYSTATKVSGSEWHAKNPFATIRGRLQDKPHLFFKIRPGQWGLVAQKDRILEQLDLSPTTPAEQRQRTQHAWYQSLAVRLGNLNGFRTHVPPSDLNKTFQDRQTLRSIVTDVGVPSFSFDTITERANNVDVSWFNGDDLPHAFIEIEYSPEYRRSLSKYVVLRAFFSQFIIVADENQDRAFKEMIKAKEWESICQDPYGKTYDRVRFWSFEDLAQRLETAERVRAEQESTR
ncbi:MAG TPA: hypothetical protein VGM37_05615 [Armatimonadota bacterium]|jgi:hypothetical protein